MQFNPALTDPNQAPSLNINGTGEARVITTTNLPLSPIIANSWHYLVYHASLGRWMSQTTPVTNLKGMTDLLDKKASVFKCKGPNSSDDIKDSTAIVNIINDFFENGTAMSMKLRITGTMGVDFTENAAIYINATNTRGAVCYLDFSDCYIPPITTISSRFLCINNSTVKLDVTGLVVTAYTSAVNLINGSNNRFTNCTFIGDNLGNTDGSSAVAIWGSSSNNTFHNCSMISAKNFEIPISLGTDEFSTVHNIFSCCNINGVNMFGAAVHITGSTGVSFLSCKIVTTGNTAIEVATSNSDATINLLGCSISSNTNDVNQSSSQSSVKWYIMGNSFSKSGIKVDGTTSIAYKNASQYIYFPQYANKFSQTIV